MPETSAQRTEPASALLPSTGLLRRPGPDRAQNPPGGPRSGMKLMVALGLSLGLSFWLGAAWAQELAPEAQMKQFTSEVIDAIRQDKDAQTHGREKAFELVKARVLPHFDFSRMTALAMGRNWPEASAEQQSALTNEFRALLVRSLSSALSSYRNEVIEFKPPRAAPGGSQVTVKMQIRRPGAEAISIDYGMEKGASGWMVYDVVVAGVNLVTNYRETFNVAIRDGGVDGLIKSLVNKNRALESQAGSRPK
ncbi:MAG: ABC transporter substrate-binding protein [Proteobacteria bacterium]|nr:ABC transporter substrate-binding protein [Pseudomonadota bacterium]